MSDSPRLDGELDRDDQFLHRFEEELAALSERQGSYQLSAFGEHQREILDDLEMLRERQANFCLSQFMADLPSVDIELNGKVLDGDTAESLFKSGDKFLEARQRQVDALAIDLSNLTKEMYLVAVMFV